MLDERHKFNKKNRDHLILISVIAVAIVLNLEVWPDENNNCYFDSTWFNKVFLYGVVIPEALLRCVFLGFWRTNRYIDHRKTVRDVLIPCLYAGWFTLAMIYYDDFSTACYEPYPSYSMVLFTINMVIILPKAFFTICVVTFLVLFSPCILY